MTTRRSALFAGAVAGLLLAIVFVGGFIAGTAVDRRNTSTIDTSDPNLRDFLTAYQLVTHQSYYRPFNRHELVYAAIDGMLSATGDPHTLFLSPPQNRSANTQLNGAEYAGIGAIVQKEGRGLMVLSLVGGAPAASAGLRPGDQIVAIDGISTSKLSGDGAVARIHGRSGTRVRLTIIRAAKRLRLIVVRARIASVTAYPILLPNHLGELRITSFGDRTAQEVRSALLTLRTAGVRGLILDLRQNPGGYVEAAQRIVSDFLSSGVVAYEKGTNHTLDPIPVLSGQKIVSVPIAILVDGGTASAAEITSAALRSEDHAVLIGERTYGKGSMQSVYSLPDGSTVRITDRLWLTPDKTSIGGTGLVPNEVVSPLAPDPAGDPQLHAAQKYLLGRLHR